MAISLSNNKGTADKTAARLRRQARGRKKIHGSPERPRLVVTRSSRHLFVQVIDDTVKEPFREVNKKAFAAGRAAVYAKA